MKSTTVIFFVFIVAIFSAPVLAIDPRFAAGGLAREHDHQVVQAGVDIANFQPTYTYWRDQQSASLLYSKRWKYFEAAAGPAYVMPKIGNDAAAAHVRIGPRFGPLFVTYETLIRDGRSSGFILGGVQFSIGGGSK